MPYCNIKTMPSTRGKAMRMLILDQKPISVVANKYGVNRSTIWRWKKKWEKQNSEVIQLTNDNRPTRPVGAVFRWHDAIWEIPTLSSRPLHSRCLSEDIVQLVLDVRKQLRRCAEVVWHYVNHTLGIKVSLSSVRRILERNGKLHKKRRKRSKYKGLPRPRILKPGDLVEIDTIHLYNPLSGTKRYIYTVIDVYSRMAYAKAYDELRPGLAARTILEAETCFGIKFAMVQSDNGAEFSSYFEDQLTRHNIAIRHTRLHRPNDNAHIERFNRTIQEECTGNYFIRSITLTSLNNKIQQYLDYYNHYRVHLGISYRTPAEMLQRW